MHEVTQEEGISGNGERYTVSSSQSHDRTDRTRGKRTVPRYLVKEGTTKSLAWIRRGRRYAGLGAAKKSKLTPVSCHKCNARILYRRYDQSTFYTV